MMNSISRQAPRGPGLTMLCSSALLALMVWSSACDDDSPTANPTVTATYSPMTVPAPSDLGEPGWVLIDGLAPTMPPWDVVSMDACAGEVSAFRKAAARRGKIAERREHIELRRSGAGESAFIVTPDLDIRIESFASPAEAKSGLDDLSRFLDGVAGCWATALASTPAASPDTATIERAAATVDAPFGGVAVAFLYKLVRSGVPLNVRYEAYAWRRNGDLAMVSTTGDEGSMSAPFLTAVFDTINR